MWSDTLVQYRDCSSRNFWNKNFTLIKIKIQTNNNVSIYETKIETTSVRDRY